MIIVTLQRTETGDEGTFGKIKVGDEAAYPYKTIELPWRDNKQFLSCIPAGEYQCDWAARPDGGWCYHVNGVAGRTAILIHAANLGGDVTLGYKSDLEGCIGLGLRFGALTVGNKYQRGVLNSAVALSLFEAQLGYHSFTLAVVDIPGPTTNK
jgi:hypothetical protein